MKEIVGLSYLIRLGTSNMSYAVGQMEKLFQSNSRNGQLWLLVIIVHINRNLDTLEILW